MFLYVQTINKGKKTVFLIRMWRNRHDYYYEKEKKKNIIYTRWKRNKKSIFILTIKKKNILNEQKKEKKLARKKKEIKEKKKFVSNLLAKYNHTKTITNFFWFNLETGVDIKTSQKYSLYFLIVGVLTSSEIYQKRLNVLNINLRFSGKTKSDLICFLIFCWIR